MSENSTKNEKQIGALWSKTSSKGTSFYSGVVKVGNESIRVVVFKNRNKQEGSKAPDWVINRSDESRQASPQPTAKKFIQKSAQVPHQESEPQAEDETF